MFLLARNHTLGTQGVLGMDCTCCGAIRDMTSLLPVLMRCCQCPFNITETAAAVKKSKAGELAVAPPAPRSAHAAASYLDRYLLIFGGRHILQTRDAYGQLELQHLRTCIQAGWPPLVTQALPSMLATRACSRGPH
jgi:hypothetical protein